MLHELIHSVELEEHHNLNDFEEFIYNHFDIRRETNKFTFFENYVESWANILNILIINYENNNKANKKDNKSNSKSQDNSLLANFLDMLERDYVGFIFFSSS